MSALATLTSFYGSWREQLEQIPKYSAAQLQLLMEELPTWENLKDLEEEDSWLFRQERLGKKQLFRLWTQVCLNPHFTPPDWQATVILLLSGKSNLVNLGGGNRHQPLVQWLLNLNQDSRSSLNLKSIILRELLIMYFRMGLKINEDLRQQVLLVIQQIIQERLHKPVTSFNWQSKEMFFIDYFTSLIPAAIKDNLDDCRPEFSLRVFSHLVEVIHQLKPELTELEQREILRWVTIAVGHLSEERFRKILTEDYYIAANQPLWEAVKACLRTRLIELKLEHKLHFLAY